MTAVGPIAVNCTITSPSLAQTKCGLPFGSEKNVPAGYGALEKISHHVEAISLRVQPPADSLLSLSGSDPDQLLLKWHRRYLRQSTEGSIQVQNQKEVQRND